MCYLFYRAETGCNERLHRRDSIFEIKVLHLEPGVVVDDALMAELKAALQACARFA